jgi:signal transduction histidine kinase
LRISDYFSRLLLEICLNAFLKRLLGVNRFVLSPQEYKRVLLTGQLNFIFLLALLAFTLMDMAWGYLYPLPFNIAAILASVIVFFLNRQGQFLTARVLLVIAVNSISLYFTAVLSRDIGIFMFAICINVGVLAAFGYENLRAALMMILVSTAGFLMAMLHTFERLDRVDIASPAYAERNLIFGFLIATGSSVTVVYYLLRANHEFEASLLLKERYIAAKNRELIEVNTELDKFFYSASHDLRAPLTSMQGLIRLMEESQDIEELKQYSSLLKGRVENLEQFVRTITAYSSNARSEVQLQPVVLRDILREALENVRFYPKADSITIHLDVPASVVIQSDPTRLQIVFGNLIANSIKYHDFTKPNCFIAISHKVEGQSISIQIEDNGCGIPEEVLPRIFDMFYRGHSQSEGSGLGLYIVREALEKLGGSIDVKSVYGMGSTFTITLPS